MKALRYILPFIAVLPALILRDFTPDNELRYLSIADEALANGDIFTFTNHGVAYADKPPLYIWIVMLGKMLFGRHVMIFLGLFSFIPALVTAGVMNRWVHQELNDSDTETGHWMLLTSGLFLGAALVLRMDMLMTMFIVLALHTFYKLYSTARPRLADRMLFPVWVFLALFTKGPVGFLMPLVTTLTFLLVIRRLRTVGRYWGLTTWGILLLLCGGWFLGVYIEGGPDYLNNLLFNQTVNRAVDSFHHKAPFWYYGLSIWYSLAPWSLLMVGILIAGIAKKMVRTDLERFFLCAALSTFVMLSVISSKIQIYLLPAFPFFSYLAVLWLPRFRRRGWLAFLAVIPAVIFILSLPSFIFAGKGLLPDIPRTFPVWAALGLLAFSGLTSLILLSKKHLNAGINTLAVGMLSAIFAGSFVLPSINNMIGYGQVSHNAIRVMEESGAQELYSYRVSRVENIDVYIGRSPVQILRGGLSDSLQSIDPLKRPSVLMMRKRDLVRDPELVDFIGEREIAFYGDNGIVVLENLPDPAATQSRQTEVTEAQVNNADLTILH